MALHFLRAQWVDFKMAEELLYGGPTKRFFVSMLTRDIDLDNAILDLIDNSVDGAMRQTPKRRRIKKPYVGYWAQIKLSKQGFFMSDNCGGIQDDRLASAFRLGRPETKLDKDIPTIGMYGIGMKRAIFKIGQEATVESSSSDGVRKITYSKAWLDDQAENADTFWDLNIERRKSRKDRGVKISVPELKPKVARRFDNSAFIEDLKRKIGSHFGYLILKGFRIKVNGVQIEPRTPHLYFARGQKGTLNPFDYLAEANGVRIKVTVGFFRPLPSAEELDMEEEAPHTREDAGISVICNDRVILHNDTTFRTSWGTRGVPKFHNQFMVIGGIISFLSNDANVLPVSTTKNDIDMETEIYHHALSVCSDALKVFTTFTNKWKGRSTETKKYFQQARRVEAATEIVLAESTKGRKISRTGGRRFRPDLPMPEIVKKERLISFRRAIKDIDLVSDHLFNEVRSAAEVGEECFDQTLAKAKEANK